MSAPLVDEDGVEYFGRSRPSVRETNARRRAGRPAPQGPKVLPLERIRTDGGTQSRAEVDPDVCAEYSELYRAGTTLPPVLVYYDGEAYWLADGFHRIRGLELAGRTDVAVEIRQGTQRDAVLASCGVNAAHGLRRTNGDKRRAVEVLLRDPEWSTWSDRQIAKSCVVDHRFVGRVRAELTGDVPSERTYTTRHGTVATMETGNIGRRQNDPPPVDFPTISATRTSDPDHTRVVAESTSPRSAVGALLAGVELGLPAPTPALPNDQRAPNDGYWTPLPWARACVRWLDEHGLIRADLPYGSPSLKPENGARTAVEPAVGGGNWVTALREVRPDWTVDRFDIDSTVPGLELDRRETEDAIRRSWLELLDGGRERGKPRRWVWDLCLGNPPYRDAPDGDLIRFLEVSLARSWTCAFLLRETFTGTGDRLPWWRKHRPAWILKTVGTGENPSRPKWEGPGRRDNSDSCDSVLVVWTQGVDPKTGRPMKTAETRFDWLEVPG